MDQHFYNGFIKRAQEYGLSEKVANETLNKVMETLGFSPHMARLGKGYLDQALMRAQNFSLRHPTLTSGIGYGLGGAALGGLIPDKDEKGKTHRLRNALIGGLLAGSSAAGIKEYNEPQDAMGKLNRVLNNADQAIRTAKELGNFGNPLSNEYRSQVLKNIFNEARNLNLGLTQ